MPISISSQNIREKLSFLKIRLPKQPSAVNGLYSLPTEFAKDIERSNYSQASIQKISDHIGYYLGVLKSVKITFKEEFTDGRWYGTRDGIVVGDQKESPMGGLYKVDGFDHNEILLIRKQKYKFKHILAILAHECTHNYLFHHGIRESENLENEILTELATAYLGLGHLLIPGYKAITWTRGRRNYGFTIGYVTPDTIRKAIIMSTELRSWNPKEVISNFSNPWDKILAYFQLQPYRIRIRKTEREKRKSLVLVENRTELINSLKIDIDNIYKVYNQVCALIKNISIATDPASITADDGRKLVEITNKISIGEPIFSIKSISENIESLNTTFVNKEDIVQLVKQVDESKKILSKWHELLCKYCNNA